MKKEIQNQRGSIILQSLVIMGVVLSVGYLGIEMAQRGAKTAFTAGTSASLKEFVLSLQMALSKTADCGNIIQLSSSGGPKPGTFWVAGLVNKPLGFKVSPSAFIAFAPIGIASPLPSAPLTFKPAELVFVSKLSSPNPAAGTYLQTVPLLIHRFLANVEISAIRGNLGKTKETLFMGSAETSIEKFPIELEFDGTGAFRGCSTRAIFQVPLGPPGAGNKTGTQCIDMNGFPVIDINLNYYVCRIPEPAIRRCGDIVALPANGKNAAGDSSYPGGAGWQLPSAANLATLQADFGSNNASYCY